MKNSWYPNYCICTSQRIIYIILDLKSVIFLWMIDLCKTAAINPNCVFDLHNISIKYWLWRRNFLIQLVSPSSIWFIVLYFEREQEYLRNRKWECFRFEGNRKIIHEFIISEDTPSRKIKWMWIRSPFPTTEDSIEERKRRSQLRS